MTGLLTNLLIKFAQVAKHEGHVKLIDLSDESTSCECIRNREIALRFMADLLDRDVLLLVLALTAVD